MKMTSASDVSQQYSTSDKLAARARLHQNYTVAEVGWFEWVAPQLGLKNGDHVLDIGCGPGWFWAGATPLLPDRITLTLGDQSPGMVAEALQRCRSLRNWVVEGREANVMSLPFADDSFDAVVAMHMLYHAADQQKAIAEMHRVLKPGGLLAVTTNGRDNLKQLYALTTTLGSDPIDPSAVLFGFGDADWLMSAQFGNVTREVHPGHLHVTSPEDVFLALTSYPPGDRADAAILTAFRKRIDEAFRQGGGALDVTKEVGLLLSRKG
jgi:ubiquinone/menaquinone biosynthesis C-methylase UbiE